jgi:DNA polymerase epsilon subunit 1
LDVLFSKAESLSEEELVELIAENRSMSKTLAEYADVHQYGAPVGRVYGRSDGENIKVSFIISQKPIGAPVTERAVPVAILSAEESVKRMYPRKWLKDTGLSNFELRPILGWEYYIERLGSVIQKLITIPAAMQKVANPVPRIRHPDWLHRRVVAMDDKFKQHKVTDFLKRGPAAAEESRTSELPDLEEVGGGGSQKRIRIVVNKRRSTRPREETQKHLCWILMSAIQRG